MRVLVAGASGFIGSHLCRRLDRDGHEVVALSRRPSNAMRRVPSIQQAFRWEATEGPPPSESLYGVDVVVSLMGETVQGRWTESKKRAIHESRALGTRHLVEAMRQSEIKPKVLVSASAIGFYGDRGDEMLSESSSQGGDFLAGSTATWEEETFKATDFGVRVVALRNSIVLGQDGGALKQMLTPYKMGAGGPLGTGDQWWPWIHIDDEVAMILFAIEHDEVDGVLNAASPNPLRQIDFSKTLAQVLGRPAFMPTPAFVLKTVFGEFSGELLSSKRVLPRRAQELGFEFQYPQLEDALRDILSRPTK